LCPNPAQGSAAPLITQKNYKGVTDGIRARLELVNESVAGLRSARLTRNRSAVR